MGNSDSKEVKDAEKRINSYDTLVQAMLKEQKGNKPETPQAKLTEKEQGKKADNKQGATQSVLQSSTPKPEKDAKESKGVDKDKDVKEDGAKLKTRARSKDKPGHHLRGLQKGRAKAKEMVK